MCLNCNFTIKIRQNTTSHTQALCFNCSWMVLVTQIHKLQFNWVTYILTLIVHNRGSKISNTPPHMFLLENELFDFKKSLKRLTLYIWEPSGMFVVHEAPFSPQKSPKGWHWMPLATNRVKVKCKRRLGWPKKRTLLCFYIYSTTLTKSNFKTFCCKLNAIIWYFEWGMAKMNVCVFVLN